MQVTPNTMEDSGMQRRLRHNHVPNSSLAIEEERPKPNVLPSRWNTLEFYGYYVVLLAAIPYVIWSAIALSSEERPNFDKYRDKLEHGWFLGRYIDNSDIQYASFRDNIPTLVGVVVLHILLSKAVIGFTGSSDKSTRIALSIAFSLVFLFILFGWSLLKILLICLVNFGIGRMFRSTVLNPLATWTFGIAILFINEYFNGYKYSALHSGLQFMDENDGLMRWDVHFNFTVLRMISYNVDYYWSFNDLGYEGENKIIDRERVKRSCRGADYNIINYFAYLMYAPLFLAGPVITYNDFISQLYVKSKQITGRGTLVYALRLLGALVLMEVMLHFIYVVAISKAMALENFTPFELTLVGYFNLKYIWLKLLIIWRFFRLWGLTDNIYTEENMIRCMTNNYSAQGFWRSWHRSYNRWLIRYIYVPLGGGKSALLNTWVIFTFVAVWHDISLTLLAWGWLISLFILPEVIATKLSPKFKNWKHFRHLCAVGGALSMICMGLVNLVGFVVGLDGTKHLMIEIATSYKGMFFIVLAMGFLFALVQILFEIREHEKRQGKTDIRY